MSFREPFPRTLRAQLLGHRLRELRVQRGMTLQATAEYLGRDFSALARYEKAEWPLRRSDVVALLDIYGVFDSRQRTRLLHLCEESWRTDEWDVDFADTVDEQVFVDYGWLETRAREICSYSAVLLPGLLQTGAYAEAMIRLVEQAGVPAPKVLRWPEPPSDRHGTPRPGRKKICAVLDEAVLHRVVGDTAVMREQLEHLAALAGEPYVDIRVLPEPVNLAARCNGPFHPFRMADPYPEVAYLENLAGRLYLEAPRSKRFAIAFDRLREAALGRTESVERIAAAARAR